MYKMIITSHPDYRTNNQVSTKDNQGKIEYPQWNKEMYYMKDIIIS